MVESVKELSYRGGLPVYLSRYVIFGGEERRAALRFFNAGEAAATGIRYRLDELDENGNILRSRVYAQDGLSAERGCEFGVFDAAIGKDCVALDATVEAVYSGEYEYVAGSGGVSLRYGGGEVSRETETTFLRDPKHSVSRRKKKYILFAIGLTLGFALLFAGIAWRLGYFKRSSGAATLQNTAAETL